MSDASSSAVVAMANKVRRTAYRATYPPVEGGAVYEKVFVFSSLRQLNKNYRQLTGICSKLENTWLKPEKVNRNFVLQLRSDILAYARKWGNLRVPATLRFSLNLFEKKFNIPVSDFGDDTGIIEGQAYILDRQFWSADVLRSLRDPDTKSDCETGVSTIYKTRLKYGSSGTYVKVVPFISVGEMEDWWKDARVVDASFTGLKLRPPNHLTEESKPAIADRMRKTISTVTAFTNKWGYSRLPGNVRENCHIYQHVLHLTLFEFGKDDGVCEGTPYENVPVAYFGRFNHLRH